MSFATKVFLCLILVLMVSVPLVASAQDEAETSIEVTPHDVSVWQAKVEFWREWQAHQQLMADHIAATWEAKAAFWLAAD